MIEKKSWVEKYLPPVWHWEGIVFFVLFTAFFVMYGVVACNEKNKQTSSKYKKEIRCKCNKE
jgi:hypothetical protein